MASQAKRAHMDPTPETPDQTESSSEDEEVSEQVANLQEAVSDSDEAGLNLD